MADQIMITAAQPSQASEIVRVIRSGFEPAVHNVVIYGCDGIGEFIREQMLLPPDLAERIYVVATAGERVVGCIEMRRMAERMFLNYISVDSSVRSRGVGGRLLHGAMLGLREEGLETIELDVLETNRSAHAWYERLGFAEASTAEWWEITGAPNCAATGIRISGMAQADAVHARFGFSQFAISTNRSKHTVGRIGARWFRLTSREAIADPTVHTALKLLDRHRSVLAIVPRGALPQFLQGAAESRIRTIRMTAPVASVLERLDSKQGSG